MNVQKRTMIGGPGDIPIAIVVAYPAVAAIARVMNVLGGPISIILLLFMGFGADNLDNAGIVASQMVDNAEALPGLTATAGGDVLNVNNADTGVPNVNNNADTGVGTDTDIVNGGNEGSQFVDNDESMPGLTATAAGGVLTGLAAGGVAAYYNDLPSINEDDSEESEAPLTRREQLVNELQDTLYHVNRQRRVNMSLLRDATDVLSHRANVLDGFTDVVTDGFPDMLDEYRNIINSLRNISNRSNNTILNRAVEQDIEPANVFEDIQDELDREAGRLEDFISSIDPDAEFSSDTDSVMIADAVQEHALRYPIRDNPSDSNRATGSASS